MKKYTIPGMKLGGTSFLLHAGYVPAVRFAAERCEDVALLLLETGGQGEYLPTPGEIREIGRIAEGEGASLHVHLPTDADFGTPEGTRAMVADVRSAVERAAPLHPHTFVLHVDFPRLHGTLPGSGGKGEAAQADKKGADTLAGCGSRNGTSVSDGTGLSGETRLRTAGALREIAACLPSPEQLAVENLETFPVRFWDGWIDGTPYSRCLDVGHIWKDGDDPAPVLAAWLPRLRVVHLHGLEPRGVSADCDPGSRDLLRRFGPRPRDHRSLRLMPPDCLDAVTHPLWKAGFAGVLNLEVFTFEAFAASHAVLLRSWERYEQGGATGIGDAGFAGRRETISSDAPCSQTDRTGRP